MSGQKLSRLQEKAIACLLTEPTVEAAAAAAKVGYRTLKGWLTIPTFAEEYRLARRAVVEEAIALGQKLTKSAMLALGRSLSCGSTGAEIRGAMAVFGIIQKADELDTLAEQLARLRLEVEELRNERRRDVTRGHAAAGGSGRNGAANGADAGASAG